MSDSNENDDLLTAMVGMQQRHLRSRLQCVTNIKELLFMNNISVKPGDIKRILKLCVSSLLENHFTESLWRSELQSLLVLSCNVELPFHPLDFIIDDLLRSESFMGNLAKSLSKTRLLVIELCIVLVGFLKNRLDEQGVIRLQKLLTIIGEQMESISLHTSFGFDEKICAKSQRTLRRMLHSDCNAPQMISACVTAWIGPAPSAPHLAACSLLLNFLAIPAHGERFKQQLTGAKAVLLDVFRKRFLTAKASAGLTASSWRPILATVITLSEWNGSSVDSSESVQSMVVKMGKKAPEGASHSIALLLSSLPRALPTDAFVADGGVLAALRMARSADETVRSAGVLAIRSIVERCTTCAAVRAIAGQQIEALSGKGAGGALSLAYQRSTLWLALQLCAKSLQGIALSSDGVAEVAGEVLALLPPLLEKESDASVKLLAATAAGHWLALCRSDGSPVAQFLSGNVQRALDSGASAAAEGSNCCSYLLTLGIATQANGDLLAACEPAVLSSLVALVSQATKRSTNPNSEAVLALQLLLRLTALSSSALSALEAAKLWSVISAAGSSFLYSKALQSYLTATSLHADKAAFEVRRGGVSVVQLDEALLDDLCMLDSLGITTYVRHVAIAISGSLVAAVGNHPHAVEAGLVGDNSEAFAAISFGLLHSDLHVRQDTAGNVRRLVDAMPALSASLLGGLWQLLETVGSQHQKLVSDLRADYKAAVAQQDGSVTASSASAKYRPVKVPACSFLAGALLACVPTCAVGTEFSGLETAATHSLLVACHPYVCESSIRAHKLWKRAGVMPPPESLGTVAAAVDRASISPTNCTRRAAAMALRVTAHTASSDPVAGLPTLIVGSLVARLHSESFAALTDEEVSTLLDPQGAIARAAATESQSSAVDVEITNADRRKTAPRSARRGQFGADMAEDEDWAERLKKEKAEKAALARSTGESIALAAATSSVQSVCSVVGPVVDEVRWSLELLGSLHDVDVAVARSAVCRAFEHGAILSLLRSPLVHKEAFAALYTLASRSVEVDLQPSARDIVDALRVVLHAEGDRAHEGTPQEVFRYVNRLSGPVVRVLRAAQSMVTRTANRAAQNQDVAISSPTKAVIAQPSTVHLLFPVLRGVLTLQGVLPNSEMAFAILDSLWPDAQQFASGGPDMVSLRGLQASLLDVLLQVLAKPAKVDPSPESVLLRVATQLAPLSRNEWEVLTGRHGLLNPETKVRTACMQTVLRVAERGLDRSVVRDRVEAVLWMARFDECETVCSAADQLWAGGRSLSADGLYGSLEQFLSHSSSVVREVSARAVAGLIAHSGAESAETITTAIQQLYIANAPIRPPLVATKHSAAAGAKGNAISFGAAVAGRRVAVDTTVQLRVAIALVLATVGQTHAIPSENSDVVCELVRFILQRGAVDLHTDVRFAMLAAGKSLVDGYGKELCAPLQGLLEEVLALKHDSAVEEAADFDHRHGAAVVLLGATGRHMNKEDSAVLVIADSLLEALRTPSESVQRAVADCLAPLIQMIKGTERAEAMLETVLSRVLEGPSYGDRRGAAFGLSAVVKGLGIPSLKSHDVVPRLKEACSNGSINNRQGSLFAFECLSERLGLLFEPYIIVVVPVLIKSFSHSSEHVREAAQGAAQVIMGRLSAHGVKQVLNPILSSLPGEPAWKSRQEAINLLGMMAHCAPKQLSACLPQIVTCLVEAGSSDPHPKVKESAKAAMADISSVIRNPEISRLGPVLLAALADPAHRTKDALEALLECEFMHSIDAPSLALLVPILGRALKDRGADSKRKSAAITGNIMSMVSEPAALAPYLPVVLPGLKDCLMDPIPDVRASSAKALGSLFSGVGEEQLSDLLPWLVATLRTDRSPVERSGAAQGLSEICANALGAERLEEILETVLRLKAEKSSAPREGLLWFLSFLPMALGEGFAVHVSLCLPVILSGLSDENDGVRDVAMRAGQVVVSKLGLNHTLKLLPSLAEGMFSDDWRIRQSSIRLLGELLYLVGDTKAVGLAEGEEDDEDAGGSGVHGGSTSRVAATIRAHIGEKHTNEVLSSLYIVRSDVASAVRQAALQIWKSVVSNTPRTLVEIMPVLVLQLIAKLSTHSEELRLVAGRALGELVRKLGDRVLPVIVPHLRQGLRSEEENMRQGACLGLTEILSACTRQQAEDYIEVLMPALKQALCDPSEEVCAQAAQAFMTLFRTVGTQAVDEVVPALLETLSEGSAEEADLALRGLREIVQLRPRDLVEYLLPTLLSSPMDTVSARALASVSEVAGQQYSYHFHTLLPGLVHELYGASDTVDQHAAQEEGIQAEAEKERLEAIKLAAGACMGAITTASVHQFMSELGKQIEHETSVKRRRWGCWLAEQFVLRSRAEYTDYVPLLLKFVLSRVAELDRPLLQAVSDCLLAVSTSLPLDDLMAHIPFIRSCISSAASSARHTTGSVKMLSASGEFLLPLLTLPKSLDPLLNVLLFGVMNGPMNVRETAAEAIGELAQMADTSVLKPTLIKTTGPLIRVIGDRYPSNVKAAILVALMVLLDKGGASLKAFVPQLQTTFVKSLSDPSREVRLRGGSALGKLMGLSVRVDPLLGELATLCLQADSSAIKASVLEAMVNVLAVSGDKATAAAMDKVKAAALQNFGDDDDAVRTIAGRCVGGLGVLYEASQTTDLLLDLLEGARGKGAGESLSVTTGRLHGVASLLQTAGQRAVEMRDEAYAVISAGVRDDRPSVKVAACGALSVLFTPPSHAGWEERKSEYRSSAQTAIHTFAAVVSTAAQDSESGEVRCAAITAIKQAAKHYYGATAQHLKEFVPPLVLAVRDINIQVKYVAERALKHLSEGTSGAAATPSGASTSTNTTVSSAAFGAYLGSAGEPEGTFLRDYVRRVVSRLPADSDDEGDKW